MTNTLIISDNLDALHLRLLQDSALYRCALELKLPGLATKLMLREVERNMVADDNVEDWE